MNNERLCVFTRYPEPGTTKTRLIPVLGAESAAAIQRAMTADMRDVAERVEASRGAHVEVRFEGGDASRMRTAFGHRFAYRPQGDGDLGERMLRCFRDHFRSGYARVVIVGSDVPGIDADILSAAFDALGRHDLAIGPADDGGYYLIGLRTDVPELFERMPWGTDDVLRRTLDAAERLGLSVCRLPTLADVDRPEDIDVLKRVWGADRLAKTIGALSVIVPTLNEASRIETVLADLRAHERLAVEVVVVDGGSTDETVTKTRARGVKTLIAAPGRARQMNAGAAAATGRILLFLHADTHLPENFPALVRSTLGAAGVAAGAFQFRLDAEGAAYRVLERLVNWRSRAFQMPYGDQALFMKACTFRELGGFPELPIMEDFEMVRRLKRRGRISIVSASAVTSARRWRERGFLKTAWLNQLVIAGYCLRIPSRRLAHWYRGRQA